MTCTTFLARGGSLALMIGATVACGSESPIGDSSSEFAGTESGQPQAMVCTPGAQVSCACTDGTSSVQVCNAGGTGYELCQCSNGSSAGGGLSAGNDDPAGGTATTTSGGGLPCDVAALVEENCWTCHGPQPKFGAPMSLTSAADFAAPSTVAGETVGTRVLARVRDPANPMPQLPAPGLGDDQIAVLENWIGAGAPAGTCEDSTPGTTEPGTSDPGTTEPGTSDPGASPDGGAPMQPTEDPGVECYELRAHAAFSADPYDVPNQPDLYECFYFNPPWGTKNVHMVSARPLIDNDIVLHHWILYNNSGAVQDGNIADCGGAHPDAQFVAGWAPGGQDTVMPDDVGMVIPGAGFTLETHYNNSAGQQFDTSGVEICVTENLRPNVAAIHWLGTESINLPAGGTATGVCNPVNTEPVHVISSSPHMHLQGRHLKTTINRANGSSEILLDKPFSFDAQVGYPTPAIINPGDSLTTECTYGGPAFFGQGTNEEMCYNFVLAYPAGQLSQGGSILRQNNCTGL